MGEGGGGLLRVTLASGLPCVALPLFMGQLQNMNPPSVLLPNMSYGAESSRSLRNRWNLTEEETEAQRRQEPAARAGCLRGRDWGELSFPPHLGALHRSFQCSSYSSRLPQMSADPSPTPQPCTCAHTHTYMHTHVHRHGCFCRLHTHTSHPVDRSLLGPLGSPCRCRHVLAP